MRKLRLGLYPYAYARVSVMKGELLSPVQWQGLLKMGPHEALRYLQDTTYKQEIDELPESHELLAIEIALNRNLFRTLAKLKRIADEKLRGVLETYVQRYDTENFKTLLRGALSGIPREEVAPLLIPSINYSSAYYEHLLSLDADKLVAALPGGLSSGLPKTHDLFALENALDRWYANGLSALAERLAGQGSLLKQFLRAEQDILNIKIILRLRREQPAAGIRAFLIEPSPRITAFLNAKGTRELIDALHKSGFTTLTGDEAAAEEDLLTQLEIDLDAALLRKESHLMHQHPLTVNVILGFLFAKEIEVRNLKVLLKGKQLGLAEPLLHRLLVAA